MIYTGAAQHTLQCTEVTSPCPIPAQRMCCTRLKSAQDCASLKKNFCEENTGHNCACLWWVTWHWSKPPLYTRHLLDQVDRHSLFFNVAFHDIQLLHFQQWQNMTQSSLNENSSRTQKLMLYSFWLLLWLQRKKSLCSLELIFLPNHDHRLSCLPFFYVSLHAPYFQITNHMHVLSMTLQQVWHF